ncbi:EI24 domain-containing protein [Microbacterium rhizomatis]|uniref:EI24 domain-containing protein n=1 Tax=Microbacterium rhizomatis TaxID=1631477 RepID=A0A5J5IYP0_9MICO|nr:EI24 domain-containing protein [Microbacterium rhizomatis]KAA9105595.1 EI24 domain-containing protein [Microbacterium rhizomatis]
MREFGNGIGMLLRGFGWWRRRPWVMARGLLPAAIVSVVLLGGLIVLGVEAPAIADGLTPFADGWPGFWSTLLRVAVGTAVFGAAIVVAAVTFTALTLIVGEPFYDRIWRAVETDLGGAVPDGRYGFWRSVADGLSLIARGVLVALAAGLIGFVPVVGSVLAAIIGTALAGWLIADELSSRALTARGLDARSRRALLRAHRGRVLGFGVATQLCFLVPLGAVIVMPAAVAGSSLLAHSVLGEPERVGSTASG